jgi:multidrug efflux pump subunit AcrA (membrane-fusion protein)
MYATVVFEFAETQDALLIPASAVQDVGGQTVVFIREGDTRFRARGVRTGLRGRAGAGGCEKFLEVPSGIR